MRETRLKKVFDYLASGGQYHLSKEVAYSLQVSSRTVRNDIKELNSLFDGHGAQIIAKAGVGFALEISDQNLFESFLKNKWYKYAFEEENFTSPEFRKKYILQMLLLDEQVLKIDELLEEMLISKAMLQEDLRRIRVSLEDYNLKLISKPYKGLSVLGDEINKRKCLAECVYAERFFDERMMNFALPENQRLRQDISDIVISVFDKYDYEVTHLAFQNLVLHFYISIKRIKSGYSIAADAEDMRQLNRRQEFEVAREISELLGKRFFTSFSAGEIAYIATQLISKQANKSYDQHNIDYEINDLVVRILNRILEIRGLDFTKNLDLRVALALHFSPLLERLKYKLVMKNPILSDIRSYVLAYDLAIIAAEIIGSEVRQSISEDEIGYIALHFSAAIEKQSCMHKKKIIIVCGTGNASANMMKYRFLAEFEGFVDTLEICDAGEVYQRNLDRYDLIVSSVPLYVSTDTPIIEVGVLLNTEDIKSIRPHLKEEANHAWIRQLFAEEFFLAEYAAQNKEQLLRDISERIGQQVKLSADLYTEIMNRENLASTEFDHLVAIPHPLHPIAERTCVAVVILKEPMLWLKKEVQLIVILVLGKSQNNEAMQQFYRLISELLLNQSRVKRALRCGKLSDFINLLLEGGEKSE